MFLDMQHGIVVHTSLVSFLVNQVDALKNQLSIHGKTFLLTKDRFEEIMGVYDGGEDIKLAEDEPSELVHALLGSSSRLVISRLYCELEEDKSASKLFVVRFVLVVIRTILCPPSAVYLKMSDIALLEDLVGIKKKNWASYSLRFLMEFVHCFNVQKLSI